MEHSIHRENSFNPFDVSVVMPEGEQKGERQ